MRKRAQKPSSEVEIAKTSRTIKSIKKKPIIKKNQWISIALIGIFFMVLFLNSYFNIVSNVGINPEGTSVSEKFYLSGPDPYYNMRLVNQTLETGRYPFYVSGQEDPLLNYPLGRDGGGRAPLLNMAAIGFSGLLLPFMSQTDAIGYSMQFVPALFGALIIFPVYFIGKTLFGKKEGLIAAMFIAIIPIHIGSGHGSAFTLFDHDSLNLLLFFLTFLFLIKSIKEKDSIKSLLYAILASIPLAGLSMVWVEARFLYVVIALYAIIQIFIDIFTSKIDKNIIRNLVVILFLGYLISLPVRLAEMGRIAPDLIFFLCLGVAIFGFIAVGFDRLKIPWVISLPIIFVIGGATALVLYFINPLKEMFAFLSPLERLSEILYGSGIYGNKVSQTIAEASTYNISRSVMSYGPVLYWLAWAGLVLLMYQYLVQKGRRDYLFIIALFIIDIWLASTAGRFLNDMVPLIAILGGWVTWFVISKIDYNQMIRNIRNTGGGFRGLRKGIKIYHILGVLFIAFLLVMTNTFLALDAAIPGATTKNGTSNMKIDFFGEDHSGAFGSSSYKEQYWVDAFAWLNDQDTEIENPGDRPAFISWWDYGFYGVAVGGHPVVADNFQDGIPPAANFHTSTSEIEGIGVWIVRLIQGHIKSNDGKISSEVKDALTRYLGVNNSENVVLWMEDNPKSPSYLTPIGAEYDEELSKNLLVGEQYADNACYHDITNLINDTLNDEQVTMLYHDIQEATGYSIRYYGIEGYDAQIFNIFGFLADKSLVLYALRTGGRQKFYNPEDDFIQVKYTGYYVNTDGSRGEEATWTAEELNAMTESELRYVAITDTTSEDKPAFYETMFYRTYIGDIPEEIQDQITQLPCWGMKHFTAEYISPYPYYNSGRSAVVIAKYYEGAVIEGTVEYNDAPLSSEVVIRKGTSLYGDALLIDHDKTITEDGNFSLIAPAGNISIEIRRYPEMGLNSFVMKTIKFNSTEDPQTAPITDDEAMRKKGTQYTRYIDIVVDPATFGGYVYENMDDEEEYNSSVDEPISDVEITIWEIDETDPETGQPSQYGAIEQMTTDDNGYYNVTGLKPGIYLLRAIKDDFVIHENYAFIYSGENNYDIAKPKPAEIMGSIYFDDNDNGVYDIGEEMNNVDVELQYEKVDGEIMVVGTLTTDQTGEYQFSSLYPGPYQIKATKQSLTTGYLDYSVEESVDLIENETTYQNISIDYANIKLSGFTKVGDKNIKDIDIDFMPDGLYEDNTAESISATSKEDGSYELDLQPGYYNISIDGIGGENSGAYIYEGKVTVLIGEGVKTLDLQMTKLTVTVSGATSYQGSAVDNITITFLPDEEVENNTAVYSAIQSDVNGQYIAEIMPGIYNVTVSQLVNESGIDVNYRYSGTLEILESDISRTYDISLIKDE